MSGRRTYSQMTPHAFVRACQTEPGFRGDVDHSGLAPGIKTDAGKPRTGLMMQDFAEALTAVAEVRAERAASEAIIRAETLGYSKTAQQQFARIARREASEWEHPQHTALRIVLPQRATFAGNPGGAE